MYVSCHHLFFNHRFIFQNSNGFHDLTVLCLNISNIVIIIVKSVDYRCIIHGISTCKATHSLENACKKKKQPKSCLQLFMSDLWLGTINLNNAKYLKKSGAKN